MKVIQSTPKLKSSRAQPVVTVPPVQQHRGRMIAVAVFAVVLLALIVFFVLYGKQIAGKAIATAPTTLQDYQAGIPLAAGASTEVGKTEVFNVYAQPREGANSFYFVLSYDPYAVEYVPLVDRSGMVLTKGITILSEDNNYPTKSVGVLAIAGMVTDLDANGKPFKTFQDLVGTKPIPLVKLQFKAKKEGSATLKFVKFIVPDATSGLNKIKTFANAQFVIKAAVVAPSCTASNLGACTTASLCASANGKWYNSACVASCPAGTTPNAVGGCDLVAPVCSKTNLGACTTASLCAPVGFWFNNACVLSCPVGTAPDQTTGTCTPVCSSSNLGACTTPTDCKQASSYWSNNACVAVCPAGTKADDAGVCQLVAVCSYNNVAGCTTQVNCKSVGGLWNTALCVQTCPSGTTPNYGTMTCVTSSLCGNGKLDAGEVCDGTNFGAKTCTTEGSPGSTSTGGSLTCNSDCKTIDTNNCVYAAPPPVTAKDLADSDKNGCLSLSEYNKFKEDYKNNVNGFQDKVSLSNYNKLKEDYKNNVGGIQCQ